MDDAERLDDARERIAVLETTVAIQGEDVDALERATLELRLASQEMKTNWRLAAAVGGMAGSAFVAVVVFISTGGA